MNMFSPKKKEKKGKESVLKFPKLHVLPPLLKILTVFFVCLFLCEVMSQPLLAHERLTLTECTPSSACEQNDDVG